MSKKLNVAVVFGGRSGEHEVSVMSARAVMENLDRDKYNVMPLYVSRDGQWLPPSRAQSQLSAGDVKQLQTTGFDQSDGLALVPGVADKPGCIKDERSSAMDDNAAFGAVLCSTKKGNGLKDKIQVGAASPTPPTLQPHPP